MLCQYHEPVTSAQNDLYLLWRTLWCAKLGGVRRRDFDPGRICKHLSRVVILEFCPDQSCVVRVAGSGRCLEFGLDPSGSQLDQLPENVSSELDIGTLEALEGGEPVSGVVTPENAGPKHAFLRLPLLDASGRLRFLLCHDERVSAAESASDGDAIQKDIHENEILIAA